MGRSFRSKGGALVALTIAACGALPGAFVTAASAAVTDDIGVVLIGVEDYERAQALTGPARDLCALHQAYVSALKVPASAITILMSPERFPATSPCASVKTRKADSDAVRDALKSAGRHAKLFIHYSGHGEQRGGNQVLLLRDRPLDLRDIADAVRGRPVQGGELVLFVDACRELTPAAGEPAVASAAAGNLPLSSAFGGFARVAVIAAAKPGGLSYIRPHIADSGMNAPISYFTWAIVKGMLGFASGTSDRVRVSDFGRYLAGEVPDMMAFEFGMSRPTQTPDPSFLNQESHHIEMPIRLRRGNPNSFFFFAEVSAGPLDSAGKSLTSAVSFDLVSPWKQQAQNEYSALAPRIQAFPGPFRFPLPVDRSPVRPARWTYKVRLVFMFALTRKEFIVCDGHPVVSAGGLEPEIKTFIENGTHLVVDASNAFKIWGRALPELQDREEDFPSKPSHTRIAAPGCFAD